MLALELTVDMLPPTSVRVLDDAVPLNLLHILSHVVGIILVSNIMAKL